MSEAWSQGLEGRRGWRQHRSRQPIYDRHLRTMCERTSMSYEIVLQEVSSRTLDDLTQLGTEVCYLLE